MIKLDVADYCQNCCNFEAGDITPIPFTDFSGNEVINTIICCEHRDLCDRLAKYIEQKLEKIYLGEK